MGQGSAKLPEADMNFMLQNTSCDKETIKQWYKDLMKDKPDGLFKQADLEKAFKTLYPKGDAKNFSRFLFRHFKKDGFVTFHDFMLAISVMSKGTSKEKLEWAYAMADVDCDGTVELFDLRLILRSVARIKIPSYDKADRDEADRKAGEMFARLDLNKDGVISKDEFVQGCIEDASLCEMFAPTLQFDAWLQR